MRSALVSKAVLALSCGALGCSASVPLSAGRGAADAAVGHGPESRRRRLRSGVGRARSAGAPAVGHPRDRTNTLRRPARRRAALAARPALGVPDAHGVPLRRRSLRRDRGLVHPRPTGGDSPELPRPLRRRGAARRRTVRRALLESHVVHGRAARRAPTGPWSCRSSTPGGRHLRDEGLHGRGRGVPVVAGHVPAPGLRGGRGQAQRARRAHPRPLGGGGRAAPLLAPARRSSLGSTTCGEAR